MEKRSDPLTWTLDDEAGRLMRLTPGVSRTVGRTAPADFILDAPLVSRLHCRLSIEPSAELVVTDLESTNGTFVNGERITRATLRNGDQLAVGRVTFTVKAPD